MVKQIPGGGGSAKKNISFTITREIKVVAKNGFRYFPPQVKPFPMT